MQNRRSSFLTFLAALIPGVGYMYLGLIKKGIEILILYSLIKPSLTFIGLHNLVWILQVPIWFYTFFDTFNVARKIDKGEELEDSSFIISKVINKDENGTFKFDTQKLNNNFWITLGWGLILVGILAVINKIFNGSILIVFIKSIFNLYLIPILFIFAGLYLLFRNKN